MSFLLDNTNKTSIKGSIKISGSKSESNRLLILQQIFPNIIIENLSTSDDTVVLLEALQNKSDSIDIGHAGTAMRFLTAFFASRENRTIRLTGSLRMQERPIKTLVDALLDLGADIIYLKNEGYPPLLIKGKKLSGGKISIKGNVSSQYISALLLIAPSLPNGLEIQLEGEITSKPYIQMTLTILNKIGIKTSFENNIILVKKSPISSLKSHIYEVEPDWTSASYYYSLTALHKNTQIELVDFKKNSLQGDSVLVDIYKQFGVQTTFTKSGIMLTNENPTFNFKLLTLNLINTPDLAQTLAISCLGLQINCHLTGLKTLRIKETDRLQAIKNELEKLGAIVTTTPDSISIIAPIKLTKSCDLNTYNDHRMAMAFAPLSVKVPLEIDNKEVVSKSYVGFWEDFDSLFCCT